MNEKNKKTVVVSGLFVLMLAAGFANYALTNTNAKEAREVSQEQFNTENAEILVEEPDRFELFRDERIKSREQEMLYIESVMTGEEIDGETKKQAEQMKLELAANMENELITEGLIKTKLSCEAVVSIKDGCANVVVGKNALTEDEVTQIADIVSTQTGTEAKNIKIMTAEGR